jgi:hypothetical protein
MNMRIPQTATTTVKLGSESVDTNTDPCLVIVMVTSGKGGIVYWYKLMGR